MMREKEEKGKFVVKDEPKSLPFPFHRVFLFFFFKEERQHIKFDSSRFFFRGERERLGRKM
jgi:hypothetical protein